MDDPLLMGELHHLRQLPNQIEPGGDREIAIPCGEEVIEANSRGIMFEDNGRPEVVLGELHRLQDAIMPKVFEELKLAHGCPLVNLPVFLRSTTAERVNADTPLRIRNGCVVGLPVLEVWAFVDLVFEHVVTHPPLSV